MNIVVIDSGKNHQWILKLEDESLMRKKSSLKICPHKLLINYCIVFNILLLHKLLHSLIQFNHPVGRSREFPVIPSP